MTQKEIHLQSCILAGQRAQGYQCQARRLDKAADRAWQDGEHEASQWLAEQAQICRRRAADLYTQARAVVCP